MFVIPSEARDLLFAWLKKSRSLAALGMTSSPLARRRVDVHSNTPPFPLIESQHTQRASRDVPDEDRDPNINGVEVARALNDEADAERDDHLRDDRDVEWALRVAGALEAAGVGERDGDEQARDAQDVQELHAEVDNRTPVHAEDREQLPRNEQEQRADQRGTR